MKARKIHILCLVAAAICQMTALSGCGDEDVAGKQVELKNLFSITDDPSDPIRHRQYEIYEKYNVPVFFNDTLDSKQIGVDIYGEPLMVHETIDLNWRFDSYNTKVKYSYKYIDKAEERLAALEVAEGYLSKCPLPMRPFSILAVKKLDIDPEPNGGVTEFFYLGYRTLVFHGIENVSDAEGISALSTTIINSMIYDKVKNDTRLFAKFAAVSEVPGYYYQYKNDVEMPVWDKWKLAADDSWYVNFNCIMHGDPYVEYEGYKYLVEILLDKGFSEEEADAALHEVLNDLGRFGFIRGWKQSGYFFPANAEEDLEYFILAILRFGEEEINHLWGGSPLVMEKFNMLIDYMRDVLKLDI